MTSATVPHRPDSPIRHENLDLVPLSSVVVATSFLASLELRIGAHSEHGALHLADFTGIAIANSKKKRRMGPRLLVACTD